MGSASVKVVLRKTLMKLTPGAVRVVALVNRITKFELNFPIRRQARIITFELFSNLYFSNSFLYLEWRD